MDYARFAEKNGNMSTSGARRRVVEKKIKRLKARYRECPIYILPEIARRKVRNPFSKMPQQFVCKPLAVRTLCKASDTGGSWITLPLVANSKEMLWNFDHCTAFPRGRTPPP